MFLSVKERPAGSIYMESKGRDYVKLGIFTFVCRFVYRSVDTEMVFVCK